MDEKACPTCPKPKISCWKKGTGNGWTSPKVVDENRSSSVLPTNDFDVCIVKAQAQNIRECPTCRERFAKSFKIPDLWWKRYCRDANGYFGHETTIGDDGNTTGLITWARFQAKLTNKEHPGYEWSKINIFTSWVSSSRQTILIIFDLLPPASSCMERVPKDELEPLDAVPNENFFIDPYWIYIRVLEKLVTLQDAAVWAVRDTVRKTEKMRDGIHSPDEDLPKPTPDYRHLHETARHAIHVSETLDLAVKAARKIITQHESHKTPSGGEGQSDVDWTKAWSHTHQRLQFYEEMLTSLQDRSASNKARHFNEISLAYNMVAQFDSGVSVKIGLATQKDSEAMKTIAFLTLLFLPATFVSAVFSTSFFDYNSDSDLWSVSNKFWVFWVVAIPITTMTALLWYCRHLSPSEFFLFLWRCGSHRKTKGANIEDGDKDVAALQSQLRSR
ncbi:hypothetical protein EsH8_I_000524 [Colletotrichum jinshuiense]